MLKWMVPARGHPPLRHPASASVSQQRGTEEPIPRTTDDPLAAINPEPVVLSSKLIASKRRCQLKQEEIYCVSRTNPLFSEDAMAAGPLGRYTADRPERLSIGDGQWSDPGGPSRSTSSSGYESANNADDKRPHRQNYSKSVDVIRNPASDYRRYLALGKWSVDKLVDKSVDKSVAPKTSKADVQTVGQAKVRQKNETYVTKIQMPVDSSHSANQAECGSKSDALIPAPVWPTKAHQTSHVARHCADEPKRKPDRLEPLDPSSLVASNKSYVTKILIVQRAPSAERESPAGDETLDSIVTDSLLKWTSYGSHDGAGKWRDPEPPVADTANRPEAELAAVRQLSQCLGKRKTVATVSRALSKSGSVSAGSAAYGAHVNERESSGALASAGPTSDEEVDITYQRLDQRYVPRNGDANYTASLRQPDPALHGALPFSYLAGQYRSPSHKINSVSGNREHGAEDQCPIPIGDHRRDSLEHDRQSNSSSRSSGSRRVTFSADTVDNEPSNQSSASTAPLSQESSPPPPPSSSSSSSPSPSAVSSRTLPRPELTLDPHHFTQPYHQPTSAGANSANQHVPIERGRLAGYYTYNLKSHSGFHYKQSGPSGEEAGEWENCRSDYSKTLPAPLTSSPTRTNTVVKMLEPYGAVQLHPNCAFACQERGPCVDFTLDGGDISLLHRRDVSHKLRRRLCCCLLLLLCFVVLIIVVMGVSLYLSQGEKIFGSA